MKSFISGITGVILAGGKSSRFGRNKALVEFNGSRLIERVIGVMGSVFKNLIIISNSPHEYSYLKLPIHEDIIKGLGPIGGIYTGLKTIQDEMGFFVACDMPFINENLIRYMIEVRNDFDAVVPKIDWKMEPLYALYTKKCLPVIRELISSGVYQTIESYRKVRVRYVSVEEIKVYDPLLRAFMNVNKPDELINAVSREEEND